MLQAAMGSSRDGAEQVQVGDQRLRRGRLGAHRRVRRVVGDAQYEQRVSQHQLARRIRPGQVDLIEPPDLSGAEPVRRDRLDEAIALGRIGARQGHEVLHGSVRDQPAILDVLLDRLGERAHQAQAPRDPAHAAIEAPRQCVERQAVLLMQRAQQPALLERAVGRVGVQEVPKDERLGLRHLPHDGGHRVALQPTQAADPLVTIHHDVGRACRHHHDWHLLPGVRQRGQEPPFARRLPDAQPLIPQLELMKFQFHRPAIRWRLLWHRADRVLHRGPGKSAAKSFLVNDFTGLLVLRGSWGKSARFSCHLNHLPRLLVLRGAEEDSAEMAEKIGAHDAEFVLRQIPGELGKRRR